MKEFAFLNNFWSILFSQVYATSCFNQNCKLFIINYSNMFKRIGKAVSKAVNQATGHEHRKNKKRARQVQVVVQRNEQIQVLTVTLQSEEEVPDVASPQELNECPPDQHNWKPIADAVTVQSKGTQVTISGQICIHCLRMKE